MKYTEASEASLRNKDHFTYLTSYLGDKNASCVIVEEQYTDRDFLADYASYYVRCFYPYKRICTRIHFFSSPLEEAELDKLISGEESKHTEEQLQAAYLGFVVVRPLPNTVIGRTCLQTYGSDNGRRHFVTRTYSLSLFGINLKVDTLAFQEQDTVAGACATSALWSIFQGTAYVFQHHVPSPVEITNYSDDARPSESRRSPSRGLTREQALIAIQRVGLEPTRVSTPDAHTLCSTAYAYLQAGIPLYLGVQLYEAPSGGGAVDASSLNRLGGHAIALTGFSTGHLNETPYEVGEFRLRASRIDRLYGHDDQVGPFARMELTEIQVTHEPGQPPLKHLILTGTWRHRDLAKRYVLLPEELILPLYHKIRVPFALVQSIVLGFDLALKDIVKNVSVSVNSLSWDIRLCNINDFRSEIRASDCIDAQRKLELCTKPLPRFMWQAQLRQGTTPCLTVLFDATDIEQGKIVCELILEDQLISQSAVIAAKQPKVKVDQELTEQWPVWEKLATF